MTDAINANETLAAAPATEAEALAWATRLFVELPVAGLLSARPLRCDPHAQYEIRVYADAMKELASRIVPTIR